MSIDTQRTVAEIALERPESAAIFEKLGIDSDVELALLAVRHGLLSADTA